MDHKKDFDKEGHEPAVKPGGGGDQGPLRPDPHRTGLDPPARLDSGGILRDDVSSFPRGDSTCSRARHDYGSAV